VAGAVPRLRSADGRHVGRVVKLHGTMHVLESIQVRVKWENGWLSDFRQDELELVQTPQRKRAGSRHPRRPKTIVESPRAQLERILEQRTGK
jgi:hypothetical protein